MKPDFSLVRNNLWTAGNPTAASSLDTLQALLSPHSSSTSPQNGNPWDTQLHMSPTFPTHFPLGHSQLQIAHVPKISHSFSPGTLSTPHVQIFPTREDFHSQGIIYGQLGIPQLLSPCTNTLQALLFTDSSSTSPQHCDHWDTPYVWPCPPWRLFLRNQACQRRNSLRHTGIQCW